VDYNHVNEEEWPKRSQKQNGGSCYETSGNQGNCQEAVTEIRKFEEGRTHPGNPNL
jgi:hypothetical protein